MHSRRGLQRKAKAAHTLIQDIQMIALKILQILAQLGKEEIVCIAGIHSLELAQCRRQIGSDRAWWKIKFMNTITIEFYPYVFNLFDGEGIEQKFYNI